MTIKAITTMAAIATILIAAGGTVHAEQINGEHIVSDNGRTIITDTGETWNIDGGTWYESQTGETAILTPDAPQIEVPTPQPQLVPQPVEQNTPTPQPTGEHLDGQHIAPEQAPKPIEQKTPTPQPIEATDPTESPDIGRYGLATITITEPKTKDATETHKSAPADIEKTAAEGDNIKKAQNDEQAKLQTATVTTKPGTVPTALGTGAKSIDFKAVSAPLPAMGDSNIISLITSGLGALLVSTLLYVNFLKKRLKR